MRITSLEVRVPGRPPPPGARRGQATAIRLYVRANCRRGVSMAPSPGSSHRALGSRTSVACSISMLGAVSSNALMLTHAAASDVHHLTRVGVQGYAWGVQDATVGVYCVCACHAGATSTSSRYKFIYTPFRLSVSVRLQIVTRDESFKSRSAPAAEGRRRTRQQCRTAGTARPRAAGAHSASCPSATTPHHLHVAEGATMAGSAPMHERAPGQTWGQDCSEGAGATPRSIEHDRSEARPINELPSRQVGIRHSQ